MNQTGKLFFWYLFWPISYNEAVRDRNKDEVISDEGIKRREEKGRREGSEEEVRKK